MSNTNLKKYNIYEIGKYFKGQKPEDKNHVVIYEEYIPCMEGLAVGNKIMLLFWFDKSDNEEKRSIMKVHPRGNVKIPIRGVFGTHSPVRPNPIALYDVNISKIDFEKGIIYIEEEIDAFDETPLIDIKVSANSLNFEKYGEKVESYDKYGCK
ncbi:TrmO family methyltransferase domain-containing protein [Methanococcus voltae]|uniref:tRNA-Thr(GGU) m(6)t(6)A37 methyltransferase TsaA n=2 Tax=Methanococcus voltae TaxID=2188 RepID=A0A8J7RMK3_METVO|nr:TrmO family methyltransferase [Methanococcus voltae]MBP2172457.1 tRNA-Thr(GGU) m(6)t(6)A37 methyltransferase TsaA [Methanococcus voltae]MBP2201636.1 tRNA-Thr(GGU) m(6)t(6)A37 methyltransferase TsaA [Methanococcus voltae]MCS3922424.1 tRNA-Thr(GGU) m(6)t(6)A37 methyltransferase TsaA [Methanococcus voltae PS]